MAVDLLTFGCRLNIAESEAMKKAAEAAGHRELAIVNTCAVTGEAVRQARQAIRRLKREHPETRIVVTGCAAQIDPNMFAAMPEVDRVIGNEEKARATTWASLRDPQQDTERVRVNDIMTVRESAPQFAEHFESRTRAFVQVQNGCDHRCTFCIIPYGRGNSRSVPMGAVVTQIRELAQDYTEIVLTGVDVTSWGADLPGTPKLGALIKAILKHVPELKRLRLSSIDSVEIDADLMQVIVEEPRFMPHLHLSLQAGDDLILKRMKRRHGRQDAIDLCRTLRRERPEIIFGADIIAGFPTEDEDMFRRSLDLVDECDIAFLHVFPYSPRPGTPAAKMPQVARALVKERAARLRGKGQESYARNLKTQIGRTHFILVERDGTGRTETFFPVKFSAPPEAGVLLERYVEKADGTALIS
jgi:threonylcarbamoyladenosine tRNA methylthiotransferase MtaB